MNRWEAQAHIEHEHLEGAFFPTRPPFILDAIVDLTVRKDHEGIVGESELTNGRGVVGEVGFERAHVNCLWIGDGVEFGRIALDAPGATLIGRGTIRFDGHIDLDPCADITDIGRFLKATHNHFALPAPKAGRS